MVEEVVASPTVVVAFLEKSEKKTKVSIKKLEKLDDVNEQAKVSDESKNIGKAAEAIDPSGEYLSEGECASRIWKAL